MNKATAKLNNLRVTPRKVRLVSGVLRGRSVNDALAQLQMMSWRSAPALTKLLKSAASNAKNKNMSVDRLFIESITVDQGPMLKRFLPRAMGRATPIHKKMSHVKIVLGERETAEPRYFIHEKLRVKKEKKLKEPDKSKFREEKVVGREVKPGIFKRLFGRKAI